MKIALDFDGVLGNTVQLWIDKYNEKNGKTLKYTDIKQWRFGEIVGLTNEQVLDVFELCWSDWRALQPLEKNVFVSVNMLKMFGQVDIVTSVHIPFIPIVRKWLTNRNIGCNIVQSREKENLKYDIYIDDSPDNAVAITKAGKICILYDQPWNQGLEGKGIIRVKNLVEAVGVIKRREYVQPKEKEETKEISN